MSQATEQREFLVPATITDERLVTVVAKNAAEAKERVRAGHYKALGKSLSRGFLLVGEPVEKPSDDEGQA
jgi:hypothetical protein